jgi:hypothetical protein
MGRTNILFAWVLLLGLAVPRWSGAQVMTFEPDDSGSGDVMDFGTGPDTSYYDQPPPPPQGPPSQILAQALRLYEQNDFVGSSVQFQHVIEGMGHDEPANVQKAEFFLGKCLSASSRPPWRSSRRSSSAGTGTSTSARRSSGWPSWRASFPSRPTSSR